MTDLRQAAQALLDRWDSPLWKNGSTADAIADLRAALEQQAEPVCPDCKAAVLYECVACSSNNYPQQQAEPVGEVIDGRGEVDWISFVPPAGTPLYTAPPQRKPLTDEMVHKAMIALNTQSCGELQPTFEEMKVAIEAAHGIKEGT